MRLADFPVVYISYDEPWADEAWRELLQVRPDAHRVHGVKGLNACHKAAGDAAGTEWFLTVDADTTVEPAFFDVELPEGYLQPVFRLDWLSRNAVNGLVAGNGCLKLWPRALVTIMRSHEAAPKEMISIDGDVGQIRPGASRQVLMPGCYSVSDPARTPYHAFRAGFREATFLAHLNATLAGAGRAEPPEGLVNSTLRIWCSVGQHAPNGAWVIYGARLGFWIHLSWAGWDVRRVNDYGWLEGFWSGSVLPRIGPGGDRCRWTGATWDAARLSEESSGLADRINNVSRIGIADYGPDESRLLAESGLFPAARSGASVDALGHAFLKGKGVPPDITLARQLFETATLMEHPAALNNLGRLHDQALIPDADPTSAEGYYAAATALGSPHAPYHLAEMLRARGADEERRIEELLDLAAERGFAGPQQPHGGGA